MVGRPRIDTRRRDFRWLSKSPVPPKRRLIPKAWTALLLLTGLGADGDRGARFTDLIGDTKLAKATFSPATRRHDPQRICGTGRARLCHLVPKPLSLTPPRRRTS